MQDIWKTWTTLNNLIVRTTNTAAKPFKLTVTKNGIIWHWELDFANNLPHKAMGMVGLNTLNDFPDAVCDVKSEGTKSWLDHKCADYISIWRQAFLFTPSFQDDYWELVKQVEQDELLQSAAVLRYGNAFFPTHTPRFSVTFAKGAHIYVPQRFQQWI